MKVFLCIIFIFMFFISGATAQLNKKTWLAGGSGNFKLIKSRQELNTSTENYKKYEIKISPDIGYFFRDKLAAGIKTSLTVTNSKRHPEGTAYSRSYRFDYGPFVRYYLLEKEKPYNIVTEVCYQFGNVTLTAGEKGSRRNFTFMAGPSVYFNTSLALEFLAGYVNTREQLSYFNLSDQSNQTDKGLRFEIGFQFHLEKLSL